MADGMDIAATVDLPRPADARPATLTLFELFPRLAAHPLRRGEQASIGRGPDADVRLEDPAVSREHAAIGWEGDAPTIAHRGGRGGTLVNGRRIGPDPVRLDPAMVVRIGGTLLTLRAGLGPDARELREDAADGLVGTVGLAGVRRAVDELGPRHDSVVLRGETGTGKELVARALAKRWHEKHGGPYVAVNVAALSPGLFESELFGHTRGAFTGAVGERVGHIERANRGVLFLDEIGDIRDHEQQAALLRVLEEGVVWRVGAREPRKVSVRYIFATSQDVDARLDSGALRLDFWERIRRCELAIPRLRDRPEDVPSLVAHFLAPPGTPPLDVSRMHVEAMEALAIHDWPGNVRGLQNLLRKLDLRDGEVPTLADVRTALTTEYRPAMSVRSPVPDPAPEPARERLLARALSVDDIRAAVKAAGGNRTRAAETLGIGRATVCRRLAGPKKGRS